MVLSADSLGIKEGLIPAFCCGNRIGWTDEGIENAPTSTYCEDCSKE